MNQELSGKIALVTGASRGVGAEAARQLARSGATVILAARSRAQGEAVAQAISEEGGEARFVSLDVTSPESWRTLLEHIEANFGALHILINNAGVHIARALENCSEADFYQQVETNLKGVFLGCQATLPLLRHSASQCGDAAIVNVSSIAGLVGVANQTLYNMTKGGLQLFSKSLALELAPSGVRVNCVNPGMIENDMGDALVRQLVSEQMFADVDSASRYLHRQIPLRRFARSAEVARAIVHLASPSSCYMTGTEMVLDGGLTAG